MFQKAVKHEAKLRLAIQGPSGAGKTYTALRIACALGKKVAVGDTERESASKYADIFSFDVSKISAPYHPNKVIEAIRGAEAGGYDVLVLDSLSHFWNGPGGVLSIVDEEGRRNKGNTYVAWSKGTPIQDSLIEAITNSKIHIICTMRSKTEYVLEVGNNGKQTPRKVGMAPIQRDGMDYEFDAVLDMTLEHDAIVQKTRCSVLADRVFTKPGEDVAEELKGWLSGEKPPEPKPEPQRQNGNGSARPTPSQEDAEKNRLIKRLGILRGELDGVKDEAGKFIVEESKENTRRRFKAWTDAGTFLAIPCDDAGNPNFGAFTPDELRDAIKLYEDLQAAEAATWSEPDADKDEDLIKKAHGLFNGEVVAV